MSEPKSPKTLREAVVYFADETVAMRYAASLRWPDGPTCDRCGGKRVSFITTRKLWTCLTCRRQFSVKKGTIFEDSPIPLGKWLVAIWLIANCKNGVSSCEIARAIGVCQKTAWFVLHRIRLAMKAKSFDKQLCGVVEADETFIGGALKNMHKSKRERLGLKAKPGKRNAGPLMGKALVQGILERDGEVRARVLETLDSLPRLQFVMEHAERGSNVMTDEGYAKLGPAFFHEFINHQEEYVPRVDSNEHRQLKDSAAR